MICARHAPWEQATSQDPVFKRFLASPRSALLQYPISLEVCNLLERVFKIDPKRRITLRDFRKEIDKIKVFSRQRCIHESRKPSIPRTISGTISYPFRLKSRDSSENRLLNWMFEEEFDAQSFYSGGSSVSMNLSHCCVSSGSLSGSVMQIEGPTVRLVGNDDPLYNARPVLRREEADG